LHAAIEVGRSRARRAVEALYLSVGAAALAILSSTLQWRMLRQVYAGHSLTDAAATANDTREMLIAGVQGIILLYAMVAFLVWLHRAYSDVRSVLRHQTAFTPGWAVGYWFVPLVNLVRPYQIMKELWRKSHAGPDGALPPPTIALWWGAWLLSGVSGRATVMLMKGAETIPQLLLVTLVDASGNVLTIAAGLLLIGLVRGIDRGIRTSTPAALSPAE